VQHEPLDDPGQPDACNGSLGTCNGTLTTCQSDLTTCQAATPQGQLLKTGQTTCYTSVIMRAPGRARTASCRRASPGPT